MNHSRFPLYIFSGTENTLPWMDLRHIHPHSAEQLHTVLFKGIFNFNFHPLNNSNTALSNICCTVDAALRIHSFHLQMVYMCITPMLIRKRLRTMTLTAELTVSELHHRIRFTAISMCAHFLLNALLRWRQGFAPYRSTNIIQTIVIRISARHHRQLTNMGITTVGPKTHSHSTDMRRMDRSGCNNKCRFGFYCYTHRLLSLVLRSRSRYTAETATTTTTATKQRPRRRTHHPRDNEIIVSNTGSTIRRRSDPCWWQSAKRYSSSWGLSPPYGGEY